MKVCRSAYYAWLRAPESKRTLENKALSEKIECIFKASRQTYGARRIKNELALQGEIASLRRIGKLMKANGLACKTVKKFKPGYATKIN